MADVSPLCFCTAWSVNWAAVEAIGTVSALFIAVFAPIWLQKLARSGAKKDARQLVLDTIESFLEALEKFKDNSSHAPRGRLIAPETVSALHAADDSFRFADRGATASAAASRAMNSMRAFSLQAINLADAADDVEEGTQLPSGRAVVLIDHLIAETIKVREKLKAATD